MDVLQVRKLDVFESTQRRKEREIESFSVVTDELEFIFTLTADEEEGFGEGHTRSKEDDSKYFHLEEDFYNNSGKVVSGVPDSEVGKALNPKH